VVGLIAIVQWSRIRNDDVLKDIVLNGIWAGALATVAYDLVRIPIIHAGVPVFKAISYFGTVFVGADRPTFASEFIGWAYHLSNGVSFGLMYAAVSTRRRLWSAVAWGMFLEVMMLLTPYAEIFGYQRNAQYFAITLGSHAVYGMTLWFGLQHFSLLRVRRHAKTLFAGVFGIPLILALIAVDFNVGYAKSIPNSPPSYVGQHLYTVWNVPEPDRIAAIWTLRRFVEPNAEFYFIEPFDKIRFGKPFDVPEATIRRQATVSATEVLVRAQNLDQDLKLMNFAKAMSLIEVTPWLLPADHNAQQLAEDFRNAAQRACGERLHSNCLPSLLSEIDHLVR
jgi:hypothetical protein